MELTKTLFEAAALARSNAYAPHSDFSVGAAVQDSTGAVHAGCNMENASYGLTSCAERNAIAAAVAAGMKPGELAVVLLLTSGEQPAVPCGACLQVIAEFAADNLRIICATAEEKSREYRLADLLPRPFKLEP